MKLIHWLTQPWNVGLLTLPRWEWALAVGVLAAVTGTTVHIVLSVRARSRAADQEMTQEMTQAFAEAQVLDFKIRPRARAIDDTPHSRGSCRRPWQTWEDWTERLDRAEDNLVAAADPAAFDAWLAADRAAYQAAVDEIDAALDSGVWASTPWLEHAA